jgi:hypothetical protein
MTNEQAKLRQAIDTLSAEHQAIGEQMKELLGIFKTGESALSHARQLQELQQRSVRICDEIVEIAQKLKQITPYNGFKSPRGI